MRELVYVSGCASGWSAGASISAWAGVRAGASLVCEWAGVRPSLR